MDSSTICLIFFAVKSLVFTTESKALFTNDSAPISFTLIA